MSRGIVQMYVSRGRNSAGGFRGSGVSGVTTVSSGPAVVQVIGTGSTAEIGSDELNKGNRPTLNLHAMFLQLATHR
jgi:hypothetical protein